MKHVCMYYTITYTITMEKCIEVMELLFLLEFLYIWYKKNKHSSSHLLNLKEILYLMWATSQTNKILKELPLNKENPRFWFAIWFQGCYPYPKVPIILSYMSLSLEFQFILYLVSNFHKTRLVHPFSLKALQWCQDRPHRPHNLWQQNKQTT